VFLQWFVTEQVEEVATMTELLQIVRRAGEGGLLLVEDYIARSAATRAPRPLGRPRSMTTHAAALCAPRALTGADHARAAAVAEGWFGHPVGLVMHRLFFDQLGPMGVWLERRDGTPAGFLLGLVSDAEPIWPTCTCTPSTRICADTGGGGAVSRLL